MKKERYGVVCSSELSEAFKKAAKEREDKSGSAVVRDFMRQYLREWSSKRDNQLDMFSKL